jgi:hypothetical protein
MMKSQTQFFTAIGLLILILGITWYTFSTRNQELAQFFPATVNRDCAPWDGAAFTVSVSTNDETIINISIWQSPDIKLPVKFSFPDETGQVGNAAYLSPSGEYEQLSGKVSFTRVAEGSPVEGEFSFTSERGERFSGKFEAQWENEIVYCG